jgi:hypothetical protein
MGGVQQRWARLTFGWATVEEISLLQKRKQPQSQDTPLGTHSQFFRANLTNVAPDLSQPTPSVFFLCDAARSRRLRPSWVFQPARLINYYLYYAAK